MRKKTQPARIFFLLLSVLVFSCSPIAPLNLSPDISTPNISSEGQTPPVEDAQTSQPTSAVISAVNAAEIVQISSWGKGSGHNPVYSPAGDLIAVSSSSGIYLYDPDSLEEKTYIPQRNVLDMAFSSDAAALSTIVDDYQVVEGSDSVIFALLQQWDAASGALLHSASLAIDSESYSWDVVAVLSDDGGTLVTGFFDSAEQGQLTLWDVVSGQKIRSLGVSYFSGPMAFSPDHKLLAVGEYPGWTLWNVSTGGKLRTLDPGPAGPGSITSLVFSPDSKWLAAGARSPAFQTTDNTTMWEVASGRELFRFNTPATDQGSFAQFSMAFSPDGTLLATGSEGGIKILSAADGNESASISASNIESLAFSPNGTTLLSSSSQGEDSVKLWNPQTGALLSTLKGDDAGWDYTWAPSGTWLVSKDGSTVMLRDAATGEVRTLGGHPSYVEKMAFSPDGTILASSSDWNPAAPPTDLLKLWDVASWQLLRTLDGHTSAVSGVAFSPDGSMLASVSWDKTIKLWDVASGSELKTFGGNPGLGYDVAFSPDGKILAASFNGDAGDVVKLWDVASGAELRTLSVNTENGLSLAFAAEGRVLLSYDYFGYGFFQIWDEASGEELPGFGESTDASRSFALSPDGSTIALGFGGGLLKLLDIASGQELYSVSCDAEALRGMAFSPDGTLLASGCGDTIMLWEAANGQQLSSFSVTDVYELSFSPDGELLLVRSFRGMSLWGIAQ